MATTNQAMPGAEQSEKSQAKRWPGGVPNVENVLRNKPNMALAPSTFLLSVTIALHKSSYGQQFYTWLNDNYTPFEIHCYWGMLITSSVYWFFGIIFMICDLTGKPAWLMKYKVQPWKRVTASEYAKICAIVLRNQIMVAFPVSYAIGRWVAPWRGMRTDLPLPGMFETVWTWLVCMLCMEAGFYYVHRAFHSPRFYGTWHKKHHEFTAPVALASTYCTIPEHLLSNIMPILIGLTLLGSHWSMVMMFYLDLELGTLVTHSGYCVPYLHRSLTHDYHHFAFNENFGPMGILDALHGTSTNFQRLMKETQAKHGGDRQKAHDELVSGLAKWEAERQEKEGKDQILADNINDGVATN